MDKKTGVIETILICDWEKYCEENKEKKFHPLNLSPDEIAKFNKKFTAIMNNIEYTQKVLK
jgi:hypothetical protein